ncbi:pantoate--beta-alanine ligase [Halomonas sp. ZH2S]|uniref:Pantothenate synthetase n=1 Tax=Vreelandella zhuhanensis TaxID=2684210 RepID=A0A7X3GZM6_9GAMM|nr:pantoate--beta-alanine ligase [Halomonas zhuhanensis]MWJ27821.1 pantoate--beta-alanine ligase [Halomonas zhuhanensis]
MRTLRDIQALRDALGEYRRRGQRIALVPTMGNLHAGHLALVERARQHADVVVSSLFVNPMQFGPGEDLDAYPRTFEADQFQLEAAGCDVLFAPTTTTLYPDGLEGQTRVHVTEVSQGLCGGSRPGHFDGVSTVVTMLFNLVQPDVACFGEKDYQQLAVIRKLVRDLHLPIEIIGVPIVRAEDGLALSSRNGYLSLEQREIATRLYRTLCDIRTALEAGDSLKKVLHQGYCALYDAGLTPDYLELRDTLLGPVDAETREAVLLAAVQLGPTRLIDNLSLRLPETPVDTTDTTPGANPPGSQ